MQQLVLNIDQRPYAALSHFIMPSARRCFAEVDAFLQAKHQPLLVFAGEHWVGKSHLLYALDNALREQGRRTVVLSTAALLQYPDIAVLDMHAFDVILVDDIHLLYHDARLQRHFVALYNEVVADVQLNRKMICTQLIDDAVGQPTLADWGSRLRQSVWGTVPVCESVAEKEAQLLCSLDVQGLKIPSELVQMVIQYLPNKVGLWVYVVKRLVETSAYRQKDLRAIKPIDVLDAAKQCMEEV